MRDRVEAAGVHDPGAGALRGLVVRDVHPVDELRLTGEVDVVGAGLGAGGDERLAVREVGADGRDHDPGAAGDVGQRGRVGHVGVQQLELARGPGRSRPGRRGRVCSFSGLRPASAQRRSAGAWRARYSAVSAPVKPVAPKSTMSRSRSSGMRAMLAPGGTAATGRPSHPRHAARQGDSRWPSAPPPRSGPSARPWAAALIAVAAFAVRLRHPPAATGAGTATPPTTCSSRPTPPASALLDWYVDLRPRAGDGVGLGDAVRLRHVEACAGTVTCRRRAGRQTPSAGSPAAPRRPPPSARPGATPAPTSRRPGVDEPDVVKTDGSLLVRLDDGDLLDLRRHGRPSPSSSRRSTFPTRGWTGDAEILLVDDRVVVIGTAGGRRARTSDRRPGSWSSTSSDPRDSRPSSTTRTYDAALVTARSARRHRPAGRWTAGCPTSRSCSRAVVAGRGDGARAQPRDRPRQRARGLAAERHPRRRDRRQLLDCADVDRARRTRPDWARSRSSASTRPSRTTWSARRASRPTPHLPTSRATGCTWPPTGAALDLGRALLLRRGPARTSRHDGTSAAVSRSTLDGADTTYLASGEVDGSIADRWSMDEYGGVLRVAVGPSREHRRTSTRSSPCARRATTWWRSAGSTSSGVGRDDRVDALVRRAGDHGDLPAGRPAVRRRPDRPGRPARCWASSRSPASRSTSTRSARSGWSGSARAPVRPARWGAQAALFDVSDLTDPRQLDVVTYGSGSDGGRGHRPAAVHLAARTSGPC